MSAQNNLLIPTFRVGDSNLPMLESLDDFTSSHCPGDVGEFRRRVYWAEDRKNWGEVPRAVDVRFKLDGYDEPSSRMWPIRK